METGLTQAYWKLRAEVDQIAAEVKRIDADSKRHAKDLYQGNGKPSLTTRMELAEKFMENIETAVADVQQTAVDIKETIEKWASRLLIGLCTAITSIIVALVVFKITGK